MNQASHININADTADTKFSLIQQLILLIGLNKDHYANMSESRGALLGRWSE